MINIKKGFTLIELLAVILILGIIALIAIPTVNNIINEARKNSFKSTVQQLVNSVEDKCQLQMLKKEELTTTYTFNAGVVTPALDIKGKLPTSGTISVDNECNALFSNITNDKYVAIKITNSDDIIIDETTKYKETLLNGADPVIKEDLIPVIIENDGTVKKANTSQEWYNYEDKKWANAVILKENRNYRNNDIIPENNIREYFVWIPKYAYRLWNVNSDNTNNVGEPIEIIFGSSARTTGQNNGDTYIHPAFTNFNTNGIWVGKFEVSYDETSFTNKTTFLTQNTNTSATTDSSKIIVKPNVRSLTNKNVSSLYNLLYNANRNLNSHMMTNMEWGATAYLTYSVYGRCTSSSCTEVTINNINTGYGNLTSVFSNQWQYGATITGCAGDTVSAGQNPNKDTCVNAYNSSKGYLASTTGNISGIYDMSGGSWEYVMGVIKDDNELPMYKNSGFTSTTMPNSNYYNFYNANSTLTDDDTWWIYDNGMLGDATREIANTKANSSSGDRGLWFKDYAYFPTATRPWFKRGGYANGGSRAGVFSFDRYAGWAYSDSSGRVVVAY